MKVLIIKTIGIHPPKRLKDIRTKVFRDLKEYGVLILDERFTYELGEIDSVYVEGETK